jgi:phosphatidylserine/phosphatidylglycerophosphate/cardiolipin synthase-like enzyme
MSSDPLHRLGEYLSSAEALRLADILERGESTVAALREINSSRREHVKVLLADAGLGRSSVELSIAVLHAISGAKSAHRDIVPVWTMPGIEASVGHLTGEFHRLVRDARQSITCATYNFSKNSNMWVALKEASEQPGVVVTVYVDADKGDPAAVKAQLPKATVFGSAIPSGATKPVVSHAKFIVIDHELLLLTSANFSYNAENRNVEFGLLIRDSTVGESVEKTMSSKHGVLYQWVKQ